MAAAVGTIYNVPWQVTMAQLSVPDVWTDQLSPQGSIDEGVEGTMNELVMKPSARSHSWGCSGNSRSREPR